MDEFPALWSRTGRACKDKQSHSRLNRASSPGSGVVAAASEANARERNRARRIASRFIAGARGR
jgi:hypothetical protein